MKVMLFLGSGVSYPSGIPCVDQITKKVLSGDWHKHTDQRFYAGSKDEYVLRIQKLLGLLKKEADTYFSERWPRKGEANYEDLFFLCQQIVDEETAEILNPAVKKFVDSFRSKAAPLYSPLPMLQHQPSLLELADFSCEYIQCVVWNLIDPEACPAGLDLVSHLAKNERISSLVIVTINHDLLIERQLKLSGVKYTDGFEVQIGDARFFDPSSLLESCKVKLIKLHGSVNWFLLRDEQNGRIVDRYGIPLKSDPDHLRNDEGNYYTNLSNHPVLLTGSYNKLAEYNYGIFGSLQWLFYKTLYEHDIMVMSGYGWNDRGINIRIGEWLGSSPDKRLYLLHENPNEIKGKSKSFMWHRFDEEVNQGRLVPVHKFLKDASLSDLDFLNN